MVYMKVSHGRIFFDSEEIYKHLEKAEVKVYSRFGAYVMTTARGLMRPPNKKGDASKPGSPPKARKGYVKKGAFAVQFGFDTETRSVVVGPLIFPEVKHRTLEETNLKTLEEGGSIKYKEAQKRDGSWSFHAALWAKINHSPVRESTAAFAARPFMAPSLRKNLPKLAPMWENAIN